MCNLVVSAYEVAGKTSDKSESTPYNKPNLMKIIYYRFRNVFGIIKIRDHSKSKFQNFLVGTYMNLTTNLPSYWKDFFSFGIERDIFLKFDYKHIILTLNTTTQLNCPRYQNVVALVSVYICKKILWIS